jgi:hypothetical protein
MANYVLFYGDWVYIVGHLIYLMAVWCSLWSFGIFFLVLVCFDQEKSGNPDKKDPLLDNCHK